MRHIEWMPSSAVPMRMACTHPSTARACCHAPRGRTARPGAGRGSLRDEDARNGSSPPVGDVTHLPLDWVTDSKLAVDAEVQERDVAGPAEWLAPGPVRPDFLALERPLLPDAACPCARGSAVLRGWKRPCRSPVQLEGSNPCTQDVLGPRPPVGSSAGSRSPRHSRCDGVTATSTVLFSCPAPVQRPTASQQLSPL